MRASGILLPVFSLPGKYGIGCFSEQAYRFVDFLEAAGQKYWQILPLGPTSYGDSPYQSFSVFAGNPYFIDPDRLASHGWLTRAELAEADRGHDPSSINYSRLYKERYSLLRLAYRRSGIIRDAGFVSYLEQNKDWLEDHALFMALKDKLGGVSFRYWDEQIRFRDPATLRRLTEELRDEIQFQKFLQYEFTVQWDDLHRYANEHGVQIIGDIPIYVSEDSSDVWVHPELFKMDRNGEPVTVAGCPPDAYAVTGQYWGNPIYDWDYHKETGYEWWIRRMAHCSHLYDVVRIDHFRGFESYYEIPAEDDTAERGVWTQGPGMDIFLKIREALPDLRVIAEDLGFITDAVRELVKDTGFPNMKVLEFGFDPNEPSGQSIYLPYNYEKNCVVYLGTHDNDTVYGWLKRFRDNGGLRPLKMYLDADTDDLGVLMHRMIVTAHASVADLCVLQMQDYLGLDNSARINVPSTLGGNWQWRLRPSQMTAALAGSIRRVTEIYGR